MTLVGGFQSLTNTTKNFTLDFAWILNTPLISDKLLINLKIPSHASTVPVNIHLKICLLPPNLRLFLVFDLAVDLAVPKKNN